MKNTWAKAPWLLPMGLWLVGCDSADGAAIGMQEWVRTQKPGLVATSEPWPEVAAMEGKRRESASGSLRDPFAALPGTAASAVTRPDTTHGPVYLGTIQQGAEKAAVVQQDGQVHLVRAGQRLGKGDAVEQRGNSGPKGRRLPLPLMQELQ